MDDEQLRVALLKDFFFFNRYFFELKNGRKFIVSQPVSAESHFLTLARELTDVFLLKTPYLAINCPPGWSKTEFCKSFVCWALAWYPDSRFLYISYSHELASSHTHDIKNTLSMPIYRKLFNVTIPRDSSAKDFFKTTQGGAVAAFGSSGAITGRDAGLPGLDRFSGAVIIDDIHKPDEVHSDVMRDKVKRNYLETIEPRLRGTNVPIIFIGQRLHEDDLFAHLQSGRDGNNWRHVIIKGLDDAGNARYPEVMPKEKLLMMQQYKPYVFSSQYQQEPIPAGGALFKIDDFPVIDIPSSEILATFATVDSAETDKEYNDATVFSFWGLYQVKFNNTPIEDMFAIHWINCVELWIEPKDLEDEFLNFWTGCMRYPVQPQFAAIEKKSSGVTLCSVLKKVPGLKVIDIIRDRSSGSKANRFIEMQQYIAKRLISLPVDAKHTQLCLDHMAKITANDTHKRDDIADTCYDGIKFALMDKILIRKVQPTNDYNNVARTMMSGFNRINTLRSNAYKS